MSQNPKIIKKAIKTLDQKFLSELLPEAKYKGFRGKICITGGTENYTGAVYYTALASLRAGADLTYLYCSANNSNVIRSYSPELIVHPYLYNDFDDDLLLQDGFQQKRLEKLINNIKIWFPRFTCFVIGPGLGGREKPEIMVRMLAEMIKNIPENRPLILDADALYFIANYLSEIEKLMGESCQFPSLTLLTPNLVEYQRLMNCKFLPESKLFKNCIVLQKGKTDILHFYKNNQVDKQIFYDYDDKTFSINRRPGGLGDVLVGILATYLNWFHKKDGVSVEGSEDFLIKTLEQSLSLNRACQRIAYNSKGVGMLSTDVIDCISETTFDPYKN